MEFNIDDEQSFNDFIEYFNERRPEYKIDEIERVIETPDFSVKIDLDYYQPILDTIAPKSKGFVRPQKISSETSEARLEPRYDPLIYGKDNTENIVAIEVVDNEVWLFREVDGVVSIDKHPHKHWILSNKPARDGKTTKLEGNQFYKYLKEYDSKEEWDESRKLARKFNLYCVTNPVEGAMIRHGYTFFKNTKIQDVSTLSFDIETTGLHPESCETLMITNTFRKQGHLSRKLFSVDEYESEKDMLLDWVKWVQEVDPSVILGHNILGFDIPFLMKRAELNETTLDLGRDCSPIQKESFTRKFRKDGSQSYDYNRINIFGRQVLDTFFISIRYDIGRKYSSYRLKTIIAEEGLEKEGRTHFDASKIKRDWQDPEKRKLIKQYGIEDADDALKLYDLMIAAQFYLCQYVAKPFQIITESASGSQINSILVRAYLSEGYSIPLASEVSHYEGGVSFGIPGKYKNVLKLDITSAYPHCIMQYNIYDKHKDPKGYVLKLVEYFTKERLKDKKLYKETGDRYYDEMSGAKKILINSMYGFMGASGLNYNYPKGAAEITEKCRDIIEKALIWASGNGVDFWRSKCND